MRYEHVPRPLVESHYHIRMLIEGQEKKAEDRTYHLNKAKTKAERQDLINDAKPFVATEFWCETCGIDFRAQAVKEVEIDWSNPNQFIAFYKTKCFEGHWCIRLITDKERDGYWVRSRAVHRDRGVHYKDTIQPHETGFNMLYKKI